MADQKHPVIFNDNYVHDGAFKAGEFYEINDEQYNIAKTLKCGYDPAKPLIVDSPKPPTAQAPKAKE